MDKKVIELLEDKGGNYILPFFWQHGEEEAVLREYMGVILACGIKAVCVECRPHPDFCGPKWWHDMDIIMDEARKRDMKVWLLDDAHFPTGFANGALKEADSELCKQYLDFNTADICGPAPQVMLDVASLAKHIPDPFGGGGMAALMKGPNPRVFNDDKLLKVIALELVKDNSLDTKTIELTDKVVNGQLVWDVPNGIWRIFVLFNTRNGGGRGFYCDLFVERTRYHRNTEGKIRDVQILRVRWRRRNTCSSVV